MKKIFLIIALLASLVSCGDSNGKMAVQTICDELIKDNLSTIVVNDDVLKLDADGNIESDNIDGINIFNNDCVKSLIEENKDYKLTKEDMSALMNAIEHTTFHVQLATSVLPSYAVGVTMDEHIRNMVKTQSKTRVLESKTLGDLISAQ